jgi:hypothetical protein
MVVRIRRRVDHKSHRVGNWESPNLNMNACNLILSRRAFFAGSIQLAGREKSWLPSPNEVLYANFVTAGPVAFELNTLTY